MGYYANGGGSLIPKVDVKEIPQEIFEKLATHFSEIADSPEGGIWFTHEYGKYYSDLEDDLGKLAPYIKSGDIEFTGEDDEHWRFHFVNGEMEYQNGTIVYGYEPVTLESKFEGKHTGCTIRIQRYGQDDYSASWDDDYSVRGTMKQIMDEIKEEI